MSLINFGQYIAIKREQLKLNMVEAAKRINCSGNILSAWESNKSLPSDTSLLKISKAYGLPIDELQEFMPNDVPGKKRLTPIADLLTALKKAIAQVEIEMTAKSTFEMNVKNKAINNLMQAQTLLNEITIIDEAF